MMDRLRSLAAGILAALVLASPAAAVRPAVSLVVISGGYDTDAKAYFDKQSALGCAGLSSGAKRAVSDFVRAEKAAGNWNTQDFRYLLVAPDNCTASVNMASPATLTLTFTGTCTVKGQLGYSGDASTCWGDIAALDSLTLLTQNNSHIGAFLLNANVGTVIGLDAAATLIQLQPTTNKTTRLTSNTTITDTAGGGIGFHYADRVNSATVINTGYNGADQQTGVSAASTARVSNHIGICHLNTNFCGAAKILYAEGGAPIPNEALHYANLRTMLVALGVGGI